ncbi:MAG: TerB family tellurite resistance protein [Geminicoccaceae bacterium]
MLDFLRDLFHAEAQRDEVEEEFDLGRLAAACLLVEAAGFDGEILPSERGGIEEVLARYYKLSSEEVIDLVRAAYRKTRESTDLYGFTKDAKNHLTLEQRIELIEMLWEVVYADGVLHDFEASLMRRVSGLLYVDDRQTGEARKRVLQRLGLDGA